MNECIFYLSNLYPVFLYSLPILYHAPLVRSTLQQRSIDMLDLPGRVQSKLNWFWLTEEGKQVYITW